jgi:hypothetical protein
MPVDEQVVFPVTRNFLHFEAHSPQARCYSCLFYLVLVLSVHRIRPPSEGCRSFFSRLRIPPPVPWDQWL